MNTINSDIKKEIEILEKNFVLLENIEDVHFFERKCARVYKRIVETNELVKKLDDEEKEMIEELNQYILDELSTMNWVHDMMIKKGNDVLGVLIEEDGNSKIDTQKGEYDEIYVQIKLLNSKIMNGSLTNAIKKDDEENVMEENVKIVIGKDDEDKFDEIKEVYYELIQSCLYDEDFVNIAEYAAQIAEYEDLFRFVRDHCHNEKLVFCLDIDTYILENIVDLKKKDDAYYAKRRKQILLDL